MTLPSLPPKDIIWHPLRGSYSKEKLLAYAQDSQGPLLDRIAHLEELLIQCHILMQDVQDGLRATGVTAPILDNCIRKVARILEKENEKNLPKRNGC